MKTFALTTLLVLAAGCADRSLHMGEPRDGGASGPDLVDAGPPDLIAVDLFGRDFSGHDLTAPQPDSALPSMPPGQIGDGCAIPPFPMVEGPQQGTCADGLFCLGAHLNAADGYCTRDCDPKVNDCPAGAFCPMYPGPYCLKLCQTEKDCREGYICDAYIGIDVKLCTSEDPF